MGSLTESIRARFAKGAGLQTSVSRGGLIDNDFADRWKSADGVSILEGIRYDVDDILQIGGAMAVRPQRGLCIFRAMLNAAVATTTFHIFNYAGRITRITEVHTTAGTAGTAVTGHITKDADGVAAGAGVSVMSGTFNLKATADTEATATLSTAVVEGASVLEFVAGDSLAFKLTGANTTCAGVFVEVWVQPYVRAQDVSFYSAAVTSQDRNIFIFNRPYAIRAIRYRHATAETTAATSLIQVTQETTTGAAGAGTDLLANNTNTGFDGKAAANVVQVGAFTAVTPPTGDRLGVDFSASNTELAGVCITVTYYPQAGRLEVPYWLYTGSVVDTYLFSADRDYQFWDGRFTHAVAAGGALTVQLEKAAAGVIAAGAGTALLATAIDLNATAVTVQIASPIVAPTVPGAVSLLMITTAERLSWDFSAAVQSSAGFCATISLLAR